MGTYFSLENIKPPPGFTLDKPQEQQPEDFTDLLQFQDVGYKQPPIEEKPKPPPGYTIQSRKPTMEESAEKLWTGKLGAKIGGKTIVEHIGDATSKYWEERTEVQPSPVPMLEEGGVLGKKLSKEYARGTIENLRQVAHKLWGKMPSGDEIVRSMETGEPIPEAIQKEYVSVMKPKPGMGETILNTAKGLGMGVADLFTFIPATATKFVKDPEGLIYNNPDEAIALGFVATQFMKGKASTQKPAPGKMVPPLEKPPPGYKLDKPLMREATPAELARLEYKQRIKGDIPTEPTPPIEPGKTITLDANDPRIIMPSTRLKPKQVDQGRLNRALKNKKIRQTPIRAFLKDDGTLQVMDGAHRLMATRELGEQIKIRVEPHIEKTAGKIAEPTPADIAKVKADPYMEIRSGFDLKQEIARSLQYLKTGDIKGYIPTMGERTSRRLGKSKLSIRLPEEHQPGLPGMEKILSAIKLFKPMRAEQEALYTKERGQRMAKGIAVSEKLTGEARAESFMGAQKGPLEKVPYSPIRLKLTQAELNGIYDQVSFSPKLTEWDKPTAYTALNKIFGKDPKKLGIPTEGELAMLGKVFPKEFVSALRKQWDVWDRVKLGVLEASGIPRAVMASFDLSFGLRQGSFLAPRFPKIWGKAWVEQWKYLTSQKAFDALRMEIAERPTYTLMRKGKLALTDIDYTLTAREEAFMSHWAESIPGVRQSARAYTGMANKLRADVFDNFIQYQEKLGLKPYENPRLVRATADFINNATGRGKLKKLESSAVILNNIFFSPRLILARLKLLNPVYYARLPKGVRGRALQSLAAYAGTGVSFIGMAKLAERAFPDDIKVGDDPFSADFGKIVIGDTRIDIWGGFQQYIRGALQVGAGKVVSTTTGKVTKTGEGYKPLTRTQLAGRLVEYKLAPVTSFAYDLIRGSNAFGKKLDFKDPNLTENPVTSRFIPMVVQDLIDLYNDDPSLMPLSALGFFGMGLQTYEPRKPKAKKTKKKKKFWY